MVQLVTTTKCGQCHGGVSGHELIRNSWEESRRKDLKCASPEVKKKKSSTLHFLTKLLPAAAQGQHLWPFVILPEQEVCPGSPCFRGAGL